MDGSHLAAVGEERRTKKNRKRQKGSGAAVKNISDLFVSDIFNVDDRFSCVGFHIFLKEPSKENYIV